MFEVPTTVTSVQLVLTVNVTLVQRDASVIPALCDNLLVLSQQLRYFTGNICVNLPSWIAGKSLVHETKAFQPDILCSARDKETKY